MSSIEVVLEKTNPNFLTQVQIDDWQYTMDEPESKGGENQGPAPFQFLSASLASCTGITLRMYLNHKGWDYGEIKVGVERKLNATTQANIFEMTVWIEGEFNDNELKRLNRVATRCPVHKALEPGNEIRVNLHTASIKQG